MKKIVYYITAHGYGHGARSCDILNALRATDPKVPIIVKTDLPPAFFTHRLGPNIELRPGAFDLGLIQKDSIQVDLEASLETISKLYERERELIDQEKQFMVDENIGIVVADIPAIPLAAAQELGRPNIGTSNFGWNWIYSEFVDHDPRWQFFVDKFAEVYRQTDLLIRQPFAETMDVFPNIIDLPLLAKPGKENRPLMSQLTGANSEKPWVLLSFTSLKLETPALENLKGLMERYELFVVEPMAWPGSGIHSINRNLISFADTLASVDYVVTKPGFGIVSECIANDKPIIYSDRKFFLEYPILVDAIERYCLQAFIPNAELYSGNLERALTAVETAPAPKEKMPRGGAEKAAEIILSSLTKS